MFQRDGVQDGGRLIPNREVAAACRQGIWREKRIRTRRWGMSERSNTSRSSVSRDHGGEKNAAAVEEGKNERKDPGVLAGCTRDLRLSPHVYVRIFLARTDTLSPSALFLDEYVPVGGINPSPVTTHPHQARSTTTTIHQGREGRRHGRRVIFKTPLAGK